MTEVPSLDVAQLVQQALREQSENVEVRRALISLQEAASGAAFDAAATLCRSNAKAERVLGCKILKELGTGHGRPFAQQASGVLRELMSGEADPGVLAEALDALGGQGLAENCEALRAYADHDDAAVRNAVASNLTSAATGGDPIAPDVLSQLIRMTSDSDPEVRFSAVWALANEAPRGTPGVRDVLSRVLDDGDDLPQTTAVARNYLADDLSTG